MMACPKMSEHFLCNVVAFGMKTVTNTKHFRKVNNMLAFIIFTSLALAALAVGAWLDCDQKAKAFAQRNPEYYKNVQLAIKEF